MAENPFDEDQLQRMAEFMRMAALMASSSRPSLDEIESEHHTLVLELVHFERCSAMSTVAALLTFPEFHANTVRLELLQHLIQRNAKGQRKPSEKGLHRWLNRRLQGHQQM